MLRENYILCNFRVREIVPRMHKEFLSRGRGILMENFFPFRCQVIGLFIRDVLHISGGVVFYFTRGVTQPPVGPFANEAAPATGENALRCFFNEVGPYSWAAIHIHAGCTVKLKFLNGELF